MFSWRMVLGSIAYLIAGLVMTPVVVDYIRKLADDVAMVDERYVKRMYFTIHYTSERNRLILSVLLFTIWPAVLIAAILKAEKQYDIIVRHSVNRVAK